MRSLLSLLAVSSLGAALGACAPAARTTAPPALSSPAPVRRPSYLVKHDSAVMVEEPTPHRGIGRTTAYRYFDELRDAGVIFRKRALHPGAASGEHVIRHDEVYYVLSGRGELEVDGTRLDLAPGHAVFMYFGAKIRLRQVGAEDLVIIIAYPPAEPAR